MYLGTSNSDLAGRPKPPLELMPTLCKWRGMGTVGHRFLEPGEFPQLPEGFPGFPAFSISSVFLVCCQELFIQGSVISQE